MIRMTRTYRRWSLLSVILISGCLDDRGCKDPSSFCLLCPPAGWDPTPPRTEPVFDGYDQVRPDSSFGWVRNPGSARISGLSVAVNFGCDTLIWVPLSRTVLGPQESSRLASPSEMVQGVPAGPPIARISWSGGSYDHLSPADVRFDGWLSRDDTSAVGQVSNLGGDTADSLRLRVETQYGIQMVTRPYWFLYPHGGDTFTVATRDSAGLTVYPRVLEILWVSRRCAVIR
jgi:hypothetical protein